MADILLGNVRGPIGPEGQTGATGETGQAATIEIGSVSTTAYGNPAQVVNSGTEEAAILDFTIPQGKPGEQTTRMGALTLDTITAQTATFPVPAVGETGATVFGKIIKFFTDTVSALASKLNVSDVINNLTSTATDKPLSANMGRQLNSNITSLNDALTNIGTVYSNNQQDSDLTVEPATWKNVNALTLSAGTYIVTAVYMSGATYAANKNARFVGNVGVNGTTSVEFETEFTSTGKLNFRYSKILTLSEQSTVVSRVYHAGSVDIVLQRTKTPAVSYAGSVPSCLYAVRIK